MSRVDGRSGHQEWAMTEHNPAFIEIDAKRKTLVWKLMRIDEGTLRTWADYGPGKIETTDDTRDTFRDMLILIDRLRQASSRSPTVN